MKTVLLTTILSFFSFVINAQDTTNYQRLTVVTDCYPEGPVDEFDSMFYNHYYPRLLFIDFNCSFEDSVVVYANGKCIANEYMKTNHSIDLASTVIVSFEDECSIKLTVLFIGEKKFIQEELKPGFMRLDVWKGKKTEFTYSNHFYMRE